jgi:hypothetical protein
MAIDHFHEYNYILENGRILFEVAWKDFFLIINFPFPTIYQF